MENDPLVKATIRILDPSGNTKGAGFLVTPDLALPCAHLIEAAKGDKGQPIPVANICKDETIQTGEVGNFAIGKVGVEANYEVTLKWK